MRFLIAASLMAICASHTFAATGDTPAKTGFLGTTWALDCKAPASTTNFHLTYSIAPNGNLVETQSAGGKDKSREIDNIQVISKDWLLYTLHDSDGEAVNILTFARKDGRKKSWSSIGANGKAYILSGKFPNGTGGPPWFEKCK